VETPPDPPENGTHGPGQDRPEELPRAGGRPELQRRLRERRERHLQRRRPIRIAIAIVGFVITLLGLVMIGPIPGPGIVVLPIGLAILALEFVWAERLLEQALERADRARASAQRASPRQRALLALAGVLIVAAAMAAVIRFNLLDVGL
jgi:uncharacterized protein (TIGR02611 family)